LAIEIMGDRKRYSDVRGYGHRPGRRIVLAKMKTYGPFQRELLKFMGGRKKVVASEFLASGGFLAMLGFHPDEPNEITWTPFLQLLNRVNWVKVEYAHGITSVTWTMLTMRLSTRT
jgi:hypothetical protein